jgi:hypothetical protein
MDDGQKLIGLQAGAADEDTVDAMLTKIRSCVPRFDAAAVLNGQLLSLSLSTDLTEFSANQQRHFVCLLWRLMVQGIADRPDRLLSNTEPG